MITISEIVAKTEAMFDLLNEHFYQNELIRPAITVLYHTSGGKASVFKAKRALASRGINCKRL